MSQETSPPTSALERRAYINVIKDEIMRLAGFIVDLENFPDADLRDMQDTLARLRCGDYPAPCNCDDPIKHGGHQ